jgi:hypothetical protein
MANEEQVKRLLAGVDGWNKWMEENRNVKEKNRRVMIDLSSANLEGTDLSGAYLWGAMLRGAKLGGADLRGAHLGAADLMGTDLSGADLSRAILGNADLGDANLGNANLGEASLYGSNLKYAKLNEADLRGANLELTNLEKVQLVETKFEKAFMAQTHLVNLDLSQAEGLEEVEHGYESPISTSTLQLSKGKIPEVFLRGCGLSDWEIESAKLYQPGLSTKEIDDILYRVHDLRAGRALQINPLFISYSHKDSAFVDAMEKRLDEKGIRFWRDIHDATAGRLEKVVDRAMRQNPTVLLVLSENSVQSDWVEHEARPARELEKELKRDVLCPVALDGAWKDCPWPARLREQIMEYNILDFLNWKDEAEFTKKFAKLVEGLDLFYKEGRGR